MAKRNKRGPGFFIAEVRKQHSSKSGRWHLRIYGRHDNTQDIKDEDLPVGTPLQSITSAATGRIGTSPTGMIAGSRVWGFFLDYAEQYPVIVGPFSRAGKLKDDKDNTGGWDDIDEKYTDTPNQAWGDMKNTQSELTNKDKRIKYWETPEYNNAPYANDEKAKELTDAAKEKYIKKTMDLPTVAGVKKKKTKHILEMIQEVDKENKSGILPKAPKNLKKILDMDQMMSQSGQNEMSGKGLGNIMQGMGAGNMGGLGSLLGGGGNLGGMFSQQNGIGGLGSIVGQLSKALGVMGGGGGGGAGAGAGAGGGGSNYGNLNQPNYNVLYSNTVDLTSSNTIVEHTTEMLNQLGGYSNANPVIVELHDNYKEIMYHAILHLAHHTTANMEVLAIEDFFYHANNVTPIKGTVVDVPPDGYLEVFTYSTEDPHPGYIRWETFDGNTVVYTLRDANTPYVASPTDSVVYSVIVEVINDLVPAFKKKQVNITLLKNVMDKAANTAYKKARNNALGANNAQQQPQQGEGGGGGMNLMGILGQIGQMIQKTNSQHIPNSVLDQQKVNKAVQDYSEHVAVTKRKMKLAKEAVEKKNQPHISDDPDEKGGGMGLGNGGLGGFLGGK